jgi:hypothetical protein
MKRGASVAEPTLYLFDGHNLFHAGNYKDLRQLRDELASFVALKGARGVLVFDGSGADESYGPLEVLYAKNADSVLERLAAEHRGKEVVFAGHRARKCRSARRRPSSATWKPSHIARSDRTTSGTPSMPRPARR